MGKNNIYHFFITFILVCFFSMTTHAQDIDYSETVDPNKLVLISGLDFERLRINLPALYYKVYAETGITITLHSTFAEEIPSLVSFMQESKQILHGLIFAQDQTYRFNNMLLDLSPLQQQIPSLQLSDNDKTILVNEGFFLTLYFNKQLTEKPPNNFVEFSENSLGINFNTAFSTQLFWLHSGFIGPDGKVQKENTNKSLSEALYYYQQLLEQNIISPTCLSNACINEQFLNQTIPFAIDGTWMHKTFSDTLGDNLGFSALPIFKGTPTRTLRIPHVLGVLEKLTAPQYKALALFSELLLSESQAFQKSLLEKVDSSIVLDEISYSSSDYKILGCLFEKLNPRMMQFSTLRSRSAINELVKSMKVAECYE